jgi:adenylate cyclase
VSTDEALRSHIEALVRAGTVRRKTAAVQLEAEIRRREEVLRQTFRRYVSPRVADKILEDAQLRDTLLATADARAHAVVLFADLRGFTSISEQLEPHHVVPLLNEYFSLLTEITFRHEGTVFHMAGDCLMLGFGVPLEQPDSAQRAVRAAGEMLTSFAALAQSWRERYQVEAGLGIGINEGDVVAGNIGSSSYMNYTIIGDTVNIAARLCQRARAGEMLFSSSLKRTLDAEGLDIGATSLPPLQLRGRSHPIDIFCVPREQRVQLHAA